MSTAAYGISLFLGQCSSILFEFPDANPPDECDPAVLKPVMNCVVNETLLINSKINMFFRLRQ